MLHFYCNQQQILSCNKKLNFHFSVFPKMTGWLIKQNCNLQYVCNQSVWYLAMAYITQRDMQWIALMSYSPTYLSLRLRLYKNRFFRLGVTDKRFYTHLAWIWEPQIQQQAEAFFHDLKWWGMQWLSSLADIWHHCWVEQEKTPFISSFCIY